MPNESNSNSQVTQLRSTPAHDVTVNDVTVNKAGNKVGLEQGRLLSGRFAIGQLLGEGGMGSVYAAHDTVKSRDIAIKVLLPELIASAHARERFMAEAVVSCDLSHPNIVRVYDVGVSGEYLYFSMERLRGRTLRELLKAQRPKRLPLPTVTSIARQMIEALQYAQRFIVHRDLKPENIWLCADGTVKLMDFGVARPLSGSDLTRTGMAFGTPHYSAPEQWESAKDVDWRADQYSLGVMLYEMLTGALPLGVVEPPDKVRHDVPKHYGQAVMRAMSGRPEDRWESWPALLAELTVPPQRQLRWAIGFGVVVLVIAALSLYLKGEI